MRIFKIIDTYQKKFLLWSKKHGMQLPGYTSAFNRLSTAEQNLVKREFLLFEMKASRYRLSWGPLWLRAILQYPYSFFKKNKGALYLINKVGISVLIIGIAVASFLYFRATLPVFDRVPRRDPLVKLPKVSLRRVKFPYFHSIEDTKPHLSQGVPFGKFRGATLNPIPKMAGQHPIFELGTGYFPRRRHFMEVALVSESKPASFPREASPSVEFRGDNRLSIKVFLFPHPTGLEENCELFIEDERGALLARVSQQTPQIYQPSQYKVIRQVARKFTPAVLPPTGEVASVTVPFDTNPPEQLRFYVNNSREENHGIKMESEGCVFAVGDLSFSSRHTVPLPKRGIILISLDHITQKEAYDDSSLQYLQSFFKGAEQYFNHYTVSTERQKSLVGLLKILEASDLHNYEAVNGLKNLTPLPTILGDTGYKTAAFGTIPHDSVSRFGFQEAVSLQLPSYETRHITEDAITWLENNGDQPFFLFLNYNTTRTPFRPATELLSLKTALFEKGYDRMQAYYLSTLKSFDAEFQKLVLSLTQLGIVDNIDIIFTGLHGYQNNPFDISFLSLQNQAHIGGTFSNKAFGSQAETLLPLWVKKAGRGQSGKEHYHHTTHADLGGTLVRESTPRKLPIRFQGYALNNTKRERDLSILNEKFHMRIHTFSSFQSNPIKAIELRRDFKVKSYFNEFPWVSMAKVDKGLLYSTFNVQTPWSENYMKSIPPSLEKKLKDVNNQLPIASAWIEITALKDTQLDLLLRVEGKSNRLIPFQLPKNASLHPGGNGVFRSRSYQDHLVAGEVHKGDSVKLLTHQTKGLSIASQQGGVLLSTNCEVGQELTSLHLLSQAEHCEPTQNRSARFEVKIHKSLLK